MTRHHKECRLKGKVSSLQPAEEKKASMTWKSLMYSGINDLSNRYHIIFSFFSAGSTLHGIMNSDMIFSESLW